ncbi:MAG TPA: cytochrome C oxidase subunit IV family protein [Candidatus Saccharimonadales bacterium]|jgi:cytochrome c oxidase subunit 4|nr:cytochrome C oxidase subunit IV family protein [Candidatus Saccharimonadales bacterium]
MSAENSRAAESSHPTPALYGLILAILVSGTALTYFAATWEMGIFNPIVALTIACTKATLVILYFMHVRYSNKLTIITVCAGFFWLLILISLSLSDYLTR